MWCMGVVGWCEGQCIVLMAWCGGGYSIKYVADLGWWLVCSGWVGGGRFGAGVLLCVRGERVGRSVGTGQAVTMSVEGSG